MSKREWPLAGREKGALSPGSNDKKQVDDAHQEGDPPDELTTTLRNPGVSLCKPWGETLLRLFRMNEWIKERMGEINCGI